MGVLPEPIGAGDLDVYETPRGIPDLDPAKPSDRDGVHAQRVADQGPLRDLDRARRVDPKPEPRRRDPLEGEGIGEELEGGRRRCRDPLLALEGVDVRCRRSPATTARAGMDKGGEASPSAPGVEFTLKRHRRAQQRRGDARLVLIADE